jgi:hypothetical protein
VSHVSVTDMFSGGEWRAPVEYYEAILHAFEMRQPIVSFQTEDGADITLRVSSIVSVTYCSDATEQRIKERLSREKLNSE